MSRIIAKSKIPVWYTEGFNQHIYMNFALPLSLGYEGYYEMVDIRLTDDDFSLKNCLEALKNVAVTDIKFVSAAEPQMPMKTIGFAKYELNFEDFSFKDSLLDFLNQESILCTKKGKKGKLKEIDLIPKIREFSADDVGISLVLAAGSEDNLNPALIMDTFFEQKNIAPIFYSVKRTMIYNKDFDEFK
jgi:radical SAM-linked protein